MGEGLGCNIYTSMGKTAKRLDRPGANLANMIMRNSRMVLSTKDKEIHYSVTTTDASN